MRQGFAQLFTQMCNRLYINKLQDDPIFLETRSEKAAGEPAAAGGEETGEEAGAGPAEVIQRMAGLVGRLQDDERELLLSMAEKLLREQEEGQRAATSRSRRKLTRPTEACDEV